MIAALQLSKFFTEALSVKVNPFFDPKAPSGAKRIAGKLHCHLEVGWIKGNPKKYQMKLSVQIDPAQERPALDKYAVKLDLIGIFVVSGKMNEDDRERMVSLNGASILYGVGRGIVAQVTGNGPFGAYLLPALNFVKIFENKKPLREGKKPVGATKKKIGAPDPRKIKSSKARKNG